MLVISLDSLITITFPSIIILNSTREMLTMCDLKKNVKNCVSIHWMVTCDDNNY